MSIPPAFGIAGLAFQSLFGRPDPGSVVECVESHGNNVRFYQYSITQGFLGEIRPSIKDEFEPFPDRILRSMDYPDCGRIIESLRFPHYKDSR